MEDLNVMEEVCNLLDQPVKKPKKNWLHVGYSFDVSPQIMKVFSPLDPEDAQGPTEALFKFLATARPELTLSSLVVALHMIERPDAIEILDQYLPGV